MRGERRTRFPHSKDRQEAGVAQIKTVNNDFEFAKDVVHAIEFDD